MLEVLSPGFLSTVQDAGRTAYADLGVPQAGACDPLALAVANRLLGNPPGAPALEITVVGPELSVRATCVIALAGADLGAYDGRDLPAGGAYLLRRGATLAFRGGQGTRAYLALPGGIAVPQVLGSASTYLAGGFGGLDGRALRAGDRLMPARPGDLSAAGRLWPSYTVPATEPTVRVLPGPHAAYFAPDALATLLSTAWTVGPQSDRMGLRLIGPLLAHSAPSEAEILSQGIVWGAIQVPADGQPILLLADHQTTGGYPVLAVAARADRPLLGQLAPSASVCFALTTLDEAQAAYREQQAGLRATTAQVTQPDLWERLLRSAE